MRTRRTILTLMAVLVCAGLETPANAATKYFTWGLGSNTWNTSSAFWSTTSGGPYNTTFSGYDDAVFEGVGGLVTGPGGGGANSVTFNADGYVITNNAVTLGSPGGGPSFTVNSNFTAFVGLTISHAGGYTWWSKNGTGTLIFSGTDSSSSSIYLNAGTLAISNGVITTSGDFSMQSGSASILNINSGTLTVNGTNFLMGNGGANATINQTGGTIKFTGGWMGLANFGGATILNLSGGTFTSTGSSIYLGIRGATPAVLNVGGTAVVSAPALALGHSAGGSGTANLNGGTLSVGYVTRVANSAVVNFNGGILKASGNTAGFMSGLTSANIQDGGAVIDSGNFSITIAQALLNGGTGGLTKNGTGTLTLSGANTYTGQTTVAMGTLLLGSGGRIPGTVQASAGASFGGTGTVGGTTTIADGASFVPGGLGTAGTLVCSDLTLGNGTNFFDVTDMTPGGNNDLITVTNNLTVTDSVVSIRPTVPLAVGNYTLFKYTNSLTGSFAPVVAGTVTRGGWSLDTTSTPNTVYLNVSTPAGSLLWQPSTSGDWDINTSTNWAIGGTPDTYMEFDAVTYDDTGAGTNAVNVTGSMSPGSVTVNSASNYTFSGAGRLTIPGMLAKSGTGTLLLSIPSTIHTNITITGGMLAITNGGVINNSGQIILESTSGAILTIQGGAVTNNYSGANYALNVGVTASKTGSVAITSGTLAATTASTIMLGESGAGYWDQSGGVATLAGTLWLANGSGRGQITLTGGSLTVAGLTYFGVRGTAVMTLNGSSTAAAFNGGIYMGHASAGNSYTTITMNNGTLTLGGEGLYLGNGNGAASTSVFNQTGGFVNLTGNYLYIGNMGGALQQMTVSGGTFTSTQGMLLAVRGAASLTVTNTAFMTLPGLSFGHSSTSGATGTANLDGGTLKVGYINKLGGNNGTFNFNGGTLLSAGSNTNFMQGLNAAIIMDQGAVIDTTNTTITIAQPLAAGGTGIGGVMKRGSGTLTLTGANTYSGPTTINAGTLQIGNGGTTGTLGSGTVSNNASLVFNRANVIVVSNSITGNGIVTQSGTNTLALIASSTYTGLTTVAAGTLAVNNTTGSGTGSGPVNVASNATLSGTGSIAGTVTVSRNGTLAPGDQTSSNTVGILTVASASVQSNATIAIRLSSTLSDKLQATGAITLAAGSKLNLTLITTRALSASTYVILTTLNPSGLTGTFAGYPEGATVMAGTTSLIIHYTGSSVVLTNPHAGSVIIIQ